MGEQDKQIILFIALFILFSNIDVKDVGVKRGRKAVFKTLKKFIKESRIQRIELNI